jgi:hypothetical protein
MSDDKVLTKDIAEQCLAEQSADIDELPEDYEFVDLSEFAVIESEAAEVLSSCEGDLYLLGLTSLSDAAADSLSRHKGEVLSLSVSDLSDVAIDSLSKYEGYLTLDGLTSLSDAAADSLSRHKGELQFWELTHLSDSAAESLSKHDEGVVFFRFRLPPSAADILCSHHPSREDENEDIHIHSCKHCGTSYALEYTQEEYDSWTNSGLELQKAMPDLEEWERELLISETCNKCCK